MTVHEDLAMGVWEDIQTDHNAVAAMFKLRNRHIRGEMDEGGVHGTGYADALGSSSRYRPEKWPLHQHAAFVQLHALIGAGEVTYTCIRACSKFSSQGWSAVQPALGRCPDCRPESAEVMDGPVNCRGIRPMWGVGLIRLPPDLGTLVS
ncbi:hypothetical protein [Streptomyces griseofuscus]|uniref:hypothetical protein n=1 Tax=Streptomyces griseofuscus TaxID=146922 RepID=UPI0033EFB5F0